MKTPADSIVCPLYEAAVQHADRPAIHWGRRRISFGQLNQYVNAAVRSLKERGLKRGHRVALVSENSVEYVIALLAIWRLGALAIPVNPKFPDQNIRALLTTFKVQAVVIGKPFTISGPKPPCAIVDIADLIGYNAKDVFLSQEAPDFFSPDQEAVIILTSGSSGAPKAALLTYGNLYFSALGSNSCVAIDEQSTWLLSLPLYHVSGLGIVMRCLLARAVVVIAPREERARLIQEGKLTHVSMVAAQLHRLIHESALTSPKNVQAVLLGGSAVPKNLLQSALERQFPIYLSYGLTEMGSQVATGKLTNVEEACARVLHYRELTIDAQGEICVRGKTLFKGYVEGDALRSPIDQDGWFHTGDLGTLDANGCLKVLGRKDHMFISGGENIYPEEIEAALFKIGSIAQAVVVPVEDNEFGQRPVAFIRWDDSASAYDEDALKELLMQQLPKFKIPVAFYPWPSQLKEDLKVDRRYLRELM